MLRRTLAASVIGLLGCSSREHAPQGTAPVTETTSLVSTRHPVEVVLARHADAPFHLRDPRSEVGLSVRLRGASAVAAREAARETTFPRGYLARFDTLQRLVAEGVEDYIRFDSRPALPEVEYELTLDPNVAGLRLVSNILELLDARGVPRLRMAPPWIEHEGVRHDVDVSVHGCAVDTDGRVPWDRPVLAPGARTCVVRLRWGNDVAYPAVLDPAWVSTGSVSTGHNNAAMTALANGDVLIAGGCTVGTNLNAVSEIYGASTGVWTTTAPLPSKRANHTATLLGDGSVLVVGGDSSVSGICFSTGSAIKDSPIYKGGSWSTVATPIARTTHTASKLADGRVLVAGGKNTAFVTSADIFDPTTKSWTTTSAMLYGHSQAGMATLAGGSVLVAGGYDGSGVSSTAELWDPTAAKWTAVAAMAQPRAFMGLAAMRDGTAIVAGGRASTATPPPYPTQIERFSPSTKTWSTIASLPQPRQNLGALVLPSGNAIFVGGTQVISAVSYVTYANVDLVTPAGTVEAWPSLALSRATPGLALFGSAGDRVIVAGGVTVGSVPQSVEITKAGGGTGFTCSKNADCAVTLVCTAGKCAAPATTDAGTDGSVGDASDAADSTADTRPPDAATDTSVSDVGPSDTGSIDAGAAPGTSCTTGASCASGFCVDGVCCDAACNSSCLSCSASKSIVGVDGTCAPTKAGLADPRAVCTDAGATSCGTTGACNGAGGCAYYAEGTACGGGKQCDGSGTCADIADAGSDAGADSGTIDSGSEAAVDAPFTPVDPSATPTVPAGSTSCKANAECASGHCVDGVCCDRACDGVCESCTLPSSPGKCALVPLGLDPKKACSAIPCTRTCSGGGECISAFPGVQCSVSRCTSPNAGVGPTVCPAVGASCPTPVAFDCGAYACNPAFGACLRDCRTSEDCAPGRVCDVATSRCVPATTDEDSGGCAVSAPSDRSDVSPLGVGALGLAALGLARRRRSV